MTIKSIHASEILDSRGNPTIETVIVLENGITGWAAVPSGASTGNHEALELRDNDKLRYHGKGVLKAIEQVNIKIAKAIVGMDASDQNKIDSKMIELDGTENKGNLGANSILSVSLSVARAQSNAEQKELFEYLTKFNPDFTGSYVMPIPEMNVLNGGKHGNWASDIQEFMLFPLKASSVCEAIRINAQIYQTLKKILIEKKYAITVGDEGGFAPAFKSNEEPFEILQKAIEDSGYVFGKEVAIGIDAAASEFYKDNTYILSKENRTVDSTQLASFYNYLKDKYKIISMEDIFDQDDWNAFEKFNKANNGGVQTVGDDIYVTNIQRIQQGIDNDTTNCVLIKLNQIGTLSETIDAILLAKKNNMGTIVSHRSGETEDTFISDFAVAMCTGQSKSGAPCRSERVAKYNRLMKIERQLKENSSYSIFPFQPI